MTEYFAQYYLLLKSLHIMMSIAWMAGLFYLPRLFVYHTQTIAGTAEYNRFVVMEHKLLAIIMRPALIATWAFGLLNAWGMGYWLDLWFLAKIALAVPMTAVHILDEYWAIAFEREHNVHTERFFRVWNEMPTLLMIGIVLLAVYKPV
jgi:protoporphyrinogen IX oxidase